MFPYALMFHHFRDHCHPPGQGAVDAVEFEAILRFAGLENILSAGEWLERLDAGTLEDHHRCLSFDDGLLCQFDVALPVMERLGLTAFWFVYTSPWDGTVERLELYRYFRSVYFSDVDAFYDAFFAEVERSPRAGHFRRQMEGFLPERYLEQFPFYTLGDRKFRYVRDKVLGPSAYFEIMDAMVARAGVDPVEAHELLWMKPGHICALKDQGHVVGLHSHTHPTVLSELTAEQQGREYGRNSEILADLLGERPVAASHPCNSYTAETLTILRNLGIRLAFRSNLAEGPVRTPLTMPREDHANILLQMAAASA